MDENEISSIFREKLNSIEKRIDDTKNFINVALSVVGIVFVAFAIFAGFSLKQERESLNKLKDDTEKRINEHLGRAKTEPNIICRTTEGTPLEGSTIKAEIRGLKLMIRFMIKNIGNGRTTKIEAQLYSKEPLAISPIRASDEDSYDYLSAANAGIDDVESFSLPPGYAAIIIADLTDKSIVRKAKGEHPIMMKIYYGKEVPYKTEFKVLLE